jgi:hypothetical protein
LEEWIVKIRVMGAMLGFMSLASVAHATGGNGKVVSLAVATGVNSAYGQFTGSTGTKPTCHTAAADSYGFDISTNKGKAMFSLLQGAMLAGKTVGFGGASTCTIVGSEPYSVMETLDIVTVYK